MKNFGQIAVAAWFTWIFLSSATLACLTLLCLQPLVLLGSGSSSLYGRLLRKIKSFWGVVLVLIFQMNTSTEIYLRCSEKLKQSDLDNMVVIANHQMYSDWALIWYLAYFFKQHASMCVILKDSIRRVPLFGWGMKVFGFIFFARKWAIDQRRLEIGLKRLTNTSSYWLLIFPEGTTKDPIAYAKSVEFAKKQNIQTITKNVLLPRSTGLYNSLKLLKEFSVDAPQSQLNGILDVTIMLDELQPDEIAEQKHTLVGVFLMDRGPKRVIVNCERIPLSEIVGLADNDESRFTEWLFQLYRKKDDLLGRFYSNHAVMFDPKSEVNKDVKIEQMHGLPWFQLALVHCFGVVSIAIFLYFIKYCTATLAAFILVSGTYLFFRGVSAVQ